MGLTAMTLDALIKLDDSDFKKGLAGAEDKCKGFGDKVSKLGSGIAKVGKMAGAVVGAASVAVGKLALDSVQAYSEYEQLVGGVETLFGTASGKVMEFAHQAFKTAGVDANTYMETVTSFSASLLQSLGGDTEKAADIADMAMIDMADNANKMGTDMSAIQNAYQGFAKQNYTMLDNLKLGYGGTKTEMERLLKDAEKIQRKQGKIVTYSIDNLSDVYEAIHVVQTELGITGTTAEEADSTIQGSTARMKAAWNNLKVAMVDPNANIGDAITDMIDSAKIALKNWAPAFKNALKGIGSAISEIMPVLASELPGLISENLPYLISAAVDICTALATAIVDNAGIIIDGIGQVFQAVGAALEDSDSDIFKAVGSVLTFIGNLIRDPEGTIAQAWNDLQTWLEGAWEGVATWFNDSVWTPISDFFNTMWGTIEKLWTGVKESISSAWTTIAQWFDTTVWQPISNFFTGMWDTIKKLWEGVKESISLAWSTIAQWFDTTVWNPISNFFNTMWEKVSSLWTGTKEAISGAWSAIAQWFNDTVWQPIKDFFEPIWEFISELWGDISGSVQSAWGAVESILSPILEGIRSIFEPVLSVAQGIWNAIAGIFGYNGRTANIGININKGIVSDTTDEAGNRIFEFDDDSNAMLFDNGGESGGKSFGNAKGNWSVPYDNFRALLHRNEMVLTASQARRYREGNAGIDYRAMIGAIESAVISGMSGVSVNSYLSGRDVTEDVNRNTGRLLKARRFRG